MIKVYEKDKKDNPKGIQAMRNMLLQRADRKLFESDDVVEKIARFSGGCPRELLQLLQKAFLKEQ